MITKCLFPVAGFGTRFLPATKSVPKEMLPIVSTPLIQYAVEEAIDANCKTMAFVTSKYKKSIEDHFDINNDLANSIEKTPKEKLLEPLNNIIEKCNFTYIRQLAMKGLGDAILSGEPLIGDESFAVILPDDLCNNNDNKSVLNQMIQIHEQYPMHCIIAVEKIDKKDSSRYGIISGSYIKDNLIEVSDMIEKPSPKDAPSDLAIIGRYILTPNIFNILKKTEYGKSGELQITDALLKLAKNKKVLAYEFEGIRFDCGSVDGFVKATNYFYEKFDK